MTDASSQRRSVFPHGALPATARVPSLIAPQQNSAPPNSPLHSLHESASKPHETLIKETPCTCSKASLPNRIRRQTRRTPFGVIRASPQPSRLRSPPLQLHRRSPLLGI